MYRRITKFLTVFISILSSFHFLTLHCTHDQIFPIALPLFQESAKITYDVVFQVKDDDMIKCLGMEEKRNEISV